MHTRQRALLASQPTHQPTNQPTSPPPPTTVSLGLVLSGRMTLPRAIGYIVAQIVGAITGVAMAKAVSPQAFDLAKGGINALQTLNIGVTDPVAVKVSADRK